MKIKYSRDADVLIIKLREGKPSDSRDIAEGIIVCVFRANRPPNAEQTGRVIRDKTAGGRSEATLEFFS